MVKGSPFNSLSRITRHSSKLGAKIAFGVALLTFLFNYQPSFSFPPIKQNIAHAQTTTPEQTQTVDSKSVDVIFKLPHDGYITTYFSSYHPGIDLATALGTPIHPIADGTVVDEGYNNWGLGLNVIVDHGHGYQSLYAHMGKIFTKIGQKVTTGDVLGEVGLTGNTTGPHTHLQISKDGININPLSVLPQIRTIPQGSDFTPIASGSAEATTAATQVIEEPIPTDIPAPTPTPTSTPTPTPDPAAVLNTTLKIVQDTSIDLPTQKPSPTTLPLELVNRLTRITQTQETPSSLTQIKTPIEVVDNLKAAQKKSPQPGQKISDASFLTLIHQLSL